MSTDLVSLPVYTQVTIAWIIHFWFFLIASSIVVSYRILNAAWNCLTSQGIVRDLFLDDDSSLKMKMPWPGYTHTSLEIARLK